MASDSGVARRPLGFPFSRRIEALLAEPEPSPDFFGVAMVRGDVGYWHRRQHRGISDRRGHDLLDQSYEYTEDKKCYNKDVYYSDSKTGRCEGRQPSVR